MFAFLVLAGGIWVFGHFMGVPRSVRWAGIGLLYLGVILSLTVLPEGSALRATFGDSAGQWLVLGGFLLAVWAYRIGLNRLKNLSKARAAGPVGSIENTPSDGPTMAEIERNARHIVLREIGGPGQKKLRDAKVLVIGAGGLGSPVLSYLAAAGVGTIGVIDDDEVDNSNLQRQIIHSDDDIGLPKVQSAKAAMERQNPFVTVRPYQRRLTEEIARDLFSEYDLILDGTDNFETRYLANRTAHELGKPLVSGALSQWEGQLSVYDTKSGTPCYQCIFPKAPAAGLAPSCAEAGVISPLPGVVGSMMALEAIKEITGAGSSLRGRLAIYDGLYAEARVISLSAREDCETCGNHES